MKKFLYGFLISMISLMATAQQSSAPSLTLQDIVGSSTFTLLSPNFQDGQPLPKTIACAAQGGANTRPVFTWSNPPMGTLSFAFTVTDPDAPNGTWLHWWVYNIPPTAKTLDDSVLALSIQGKNSWGNPIYQGPCPPQGKSHHYVFTLYALNQPLSTDPPMSYEKFLYAVQANPALVLSQTQITGTFP